MRISGQNLDIDLTVKDTPPIQTGANMTGLVIPQADLDQSVVIHPGHLINRISSLAVAKDPDPNPVKLPSSPMNLLVGFAPADFLARCQAHLRSKYSGSDGKLEGWAVTAVRRGDHTWMALLLLQRRPGDHRGEVL